MSTLDLAVGDRVRDKRSGAVGTYQGTVHLPAAVPNGGSQVLPLLHWAGTGNAVPWRWSTDALEALPSTGARVYVYGQTAADVVSTDDDGAIVRELDDDGETWFPWAALRTAVDGGGSW